METTSLAAEAIDELSRQASPEAELMETFPQAIDVFPCLVAKLHPKLN